jgi:hypothetical protein
MSDLGGSHEWLLDVGGGQPRAMRGGRKPVERPSDDQLGVEVLARAAISDRVERLRLGDGRSAILKVGGFWSIDTEVLLYRELLRPEVDGSPALIASGPGWLLLEDVGGTPLELDEADEAFRRLGRLHRARAAAVPTAELRGALAAGPLTALDASAFVGAATELRALVARAAADPEVWEIGPAELGAADRLVGWAARAGASLVESGPATLLHGDFQRRNWLRHHGDVRLVDWELAGLGPGVLDLCFLDPDGPGAGHAPAGAAARDALDAYGGVSVELLRHAVVWGGLVGARLRLADYYGAHPRARAPRGELPAAAARSLALAAERARGA